MVSAAAFTPADKSNHAGFYSQDNDGRSSRQLHNALIAGQIAPTLLLIAGAGAAIEGFMHVVNADLGYIPHSIMSVGIPVHDGAYKTWPERAACFEKIHSTMGQVPGVTMSAISSNATPPANGFSTKFEIVGKPSSADQSMQVNMVSPEYFPVLQVRVVQGRIWDSAENLRGASVAVINQTLERRYFPNGDAVGHAIKIPEINAHPPFLLTAAGSDGPLLIVGVVGDKLDDGLSKPILPEAFIPYTLAMGMYTQILVKTEVPPLTLLHAVREKVNSVDHDQQTTGDVRDLEHWITRMPEWARGQLTAWHFGAFAALTLALASTGLYSVVSYTVAQRTNEFGIRIALGAQQSHLLNIVARSILSTVGFGIGTGLVLTLALNKLMARWATESTRDPLLLIAASLLLTTVAILACMVPARRAARVEPMQAIRYE